MTSSELLETPAPPWAAEAPGALLWVRLQLSRNLAKTPFPRHADRETLSRTAQQAAAAMERWNQEETDRMTGFSVSSFSTGERELLEARRLLPARFPAYHDQMRLYVNERQDVSVLVNGFDHVRIQCIQQGADALRLWGKAVWMETRLSRDLPWAFDSEFGYLTASPYRAGTGLRLSAALFLPGLAGSGALAQAAEKAARLGFSLRSLYDDVSAAYPYCELLNTVTLGVSEETLCQRMKQLLKDILEAEQTAWKHVCGSAGMKWKDAAWRALGTLKYARLLGARETAECAGAVETGIMSGLFPSEDPQLFYKLLLAASPAWVRETTRKEELEEEDVDLWRAVLLRDLIKRAGF